MLVALNGYRHFYFIQFLTTKTFPLNRFFFPASHEITWLDFGPSNLLFSFGLLFPRHRLGFPFGHA